MSLKKNLISLIKPAQGNRVLGFIEYFFDHIYILSTSHPPHPPRYYRKHLTGKRLNVPHSHITYVPGEKHKKWLAVHSHPRCSPDERSHNGGFLEALEDAVQNKYKTILVLKDNVFFHKNLQTLLKNQLSSPKIKSWQIIDFSQHAYAVERKLFRRIIGHLYRLSAPVHEILARVGDTNRWILDDPLLFIKGKDITSSNWDDYLYNFDPTNQCITVVCVIERPDFIENILRSFKRQVYRDKELLIVINRGDIDQKEVERMIRTHHITDYKIMIFAEKVPMEEYLAETAGMGRGYYRCKMEERDFYDAHYLTEAYEYMVSFACDVVEKDRFHVFFMNEHRGYLAGGPAPNKAAILGRRDRLKAGRRSSINTPQQGLIVCHTPPGNYAVVRERKNRSMPRSELHGGWNTAGCPLYNNMMLNYETYMPMDYSVLDFQQFGHLFNTIYSKKNIGNKIPKLIHQIWIGPYPRPTVWMQSWAKEYLKKHPGWEYRLWTEENITGFDIIHTRAYHQSTLAGKADLLRYSILYKYGGIYIDADSIYINSNSLEGIIEHIDQSGIVIAEEPFRGTSPPLIAVGVIASVAGNELLKYFGCMSVKAIETALKEQKIYQDWQVSGPLIVTEILKYIDTSGVIPAFHFYPEYWKNVEYWKMSRQEIEKQYPHSIMFQFGYSTNKLERQTGPWMEKEQ